MEGIYDIMWGRQRGVAQLVEHRSPKPGVVGSSPVAPAKFEYQLRLRFKTANESSRSRR